MIRAPAPWQVAADWLAVPEVSEGGASEPSGNAHLRSLIGQTVEPILKLQRLSYRVHPILYPTGYASQGKSRE
jgi:hypothetical protein